MLSDKLFSAHMTQHVLLLTVAPPLLLLGEPSLRLWQPLPLGFRRSVAKSVARGAWASPLRATGRLLGRPVPAFVLFSVVLLAWHVPALFDATLQQPAVHVLEHFLFLATALLFWAQVITSKPLHARLDGLRPCRVRDRRAPGQLGARDRARVRAAPLYSAYASLPSRPGGLSALADQQLAAGIMWVPGSIAFTIAIFISLYRWLEPAPSPRRNGHLRTAGN